MYASFLVLRDVFFLMIIFSNYREDLLQCSIKTLLSWNLLIKSSSNALSLLSSLRSKYLANGFITEDFCRLYYMVFIIASKQSEYLFMIVCVLLCEMPRFFYNYSFMRFKSSMASLIIVRVLFEILENLSLTYF